jgi:nicotinamide-nucleotide amidase
MFPTEIQDLAERIVKLFTKEKRRIVTAESCTGGMVGAARTGVPGSSNVFERGFITYSNDSKIDLLGVLPDVLETYGAVSANVAEAMAEGALTYSHADVAVSITGIAGPGGATTDKPIGLVYLGLATRDGARFHYRCEFKGNRDAVRLQATLEALKLLLSVVEKD